MQDWLDKWLIIGHECHDNGLPIPMMSNIAYIIVYKIGLYY